MCANVIGYHATSKSYSRNINYGEDFDIKPFSDQTLKVGSKAETSSMPGDLGIGVYFFVDIGYGLTDPKTMASRYYMRFKNHSYKEKPVVLKCEIDTEGYCELDMNSSEHQKEYNSFSIRNKEKIERIYKENIRSSAAKERKVISGLIIEMMIRDLIKKGYVIDYVTQNTITPTEHGGLHHTLPNCTEMCIRNKEMIVNVS